MKKMKTVFFCMLVMVIYLCSVNISAISTEPKDDSKYEPTLKMRTLREEVKKNSSGVMTEKWLYNGSILVEKRFYNYPYKTYQMYQKNLYHPNGKTIERIRKYRNPSANPNEITIPGDGIRITETTRYREDGTRDWFMQYRKTGPTVPDLISYTHHYNSAGTAYIYTSYYHVDTNKVIRRTYRPGTGLNHITHEASYSSSEAWSKVTYYYNYESKSIKNIVNYKGTNKDNHKVNEYKFRDDGTKDWYMNYYDDMKNSRNQVIYYNEDGYITKQYRYRADDGTRDWEIIFENDNENLTPTIDARDLLTYFDSQGKKTRQIRYFEGVDKFRWDIKFIDGKKDNVDLYNVSTYLIESNYKYKENDFNMINEFIKEDGSRKVLTEVIIDPSFSEHVSKLIKFDEERSSYFEDFLVIRDININQEEAMNRYLVALDGDNEANKDITEAEKLVDNSSEIKEEIIEDISGIKYFRNINQLLVKNAMIENIHQIYYLDKLESIDLSKNKIAIVEDDISKLEKIKEINFEENNIQMVSEKLNELNYLVDINLDNNAIVDLHDGFSNIKNISMINSRISNISDGMIEKMYNNPNNDIIWIEHDNFSNLNINVDKFEGMKNNKLFKSKKENNFINKITDNYLFSFSNESIIDAEGNIISNEEFLARVVSESSLKYISEKDNDFEILLYSINSDVGDEYVFDKDNFDGEITKFMANDFVSNFNKNMFKTDKKHYIEINISKHDYTNTTEVLNLGVSDKVAEEKVQEEQVDENPEFGGETLTLSGNELENIDNEIDKLDSEIEEIMSEKSDNVESRTLNDDSDDYKFNMLSDRILNYINTDEFIEKVLENPNNNVRGFYKGSKYSTPSLTKTIKASTAKSYAIKKAGKKLYTATRLATLAMGKTRSKKAARGASLLYRLTTFASLVKGKGTWDLKIVYGTNKWHKMPRIDFTKKCKGKKCKITKVKFSQGRGTGEWIGNVHYGYTGRIIGIRKKMLLIGAGAAQIYSKTFKWKNVNLISWGDDPRDQSAIKYGMNRYYRYVRW